MADVKKRHIRKAARAKKVISNNEKIPRKLHKKKRHPRFSGTRTSSSKTRHLSLGRILGFLSRKRYHVLALSVLVIALISVQLSDLGEEQQELEMDEFMEEYLGREKNIREPSQAGAFYPKDKDELEGMIDGFLDSAEKRELGRIRALIVPHAGYEYSGSVAASAYKQVEGRRYDEVMILGPAHDVYLDKVSILNVTHYSTPITESLLSRKAEVMLEEDIFTTVETAHDDEHSVEVQIPFIQKVLPLARIIPMLTGDVSYPELSLALERHIDKDTLLVVSSDLSHFHGYDEATKMDTACLEHIAGLDIASAHGCEACGIKPILALMDIAKNKGWKPVILGYNNSGDVTGKTGSVVGYGSLAFVSEKNESEDEDAFYGDLSEEDKDFLLKLARYTIMEMMSGELPQTPDEDKLSEAVKAESGCFVTLEKGDNLRGCIGSILPQGKLYECVMSNAANAAFRDRRFDPLEEDELGNLKIDISRLTPAEEIDHGSPEEILVQIQPGYHGVILKKGLRQATYLPQVWEMIPDKTFFLESLCEKGNMGKDCWMDQDTVIKIYSAEVFSE